MKTTTLYTIFTAFTSFSGQSFVFAESEPYFPEQGELELARSLWHAQGLTNYDFKYEQFDANPSNIVYPWTVTVVSGKPSAKDGNNNQILWATPPDVTHIFDGIQDQIDANARHVDVQYESSQGYPMSIYIIKANGEVFDAQITEFRSGNQKVLQGQTFTQTRSTRLQELAEAQALWKSKAVLNYSYQYNGLGSNPHNIVYPWAVSVHNGHDVSGKDGNGNVINYEPHPNTMEELFQRIRRAYSDNVPTIEVRYNKVYGYPESIYIVYNPSIADSTFDAEISDFRYN